LPRHARRDTLSRRIAISIHELHENTELWARKATEQEPIVLTDKGQAVAKIVPLPVANAENPFLTRKLLPGFAELQAKLSGGTDSTQIISEMREGR
jgi:antitoxin (DNA-binding transcriptional repressor) of toxin-antitoxin stability system